jgi:NADPH:quinone reductase-like Zn-dependent oxidoreductase
MKAIVINSYGSSEVLEEVSIDIPKVGRKQLLVEVHAAGVNPLDWKIRKGMMKLLTRKKFPKILGSDIAGIVKKTGEGVKQFKNGDEVFAMINTIFNQGGYAEYAVIDEKNACKKPRNLSFIDAGGVPCAAITALQVLCNKVNLKKGQLILINGASGGVGTFSVQIAKILGARVTGVCSGQNIELVASLGADDVIDYTKSDFIKGNEKYDIIFDVVGNKGFFDCKSVLSPGGIYITLVPNGKIILLSLLTSVLPGKKCKFISAKPNLQDLSWLKENIEEEAIKVVIDKTYPLEAVKEAHEYMDLGHAIGKVVLIVKG